MSKQTDILEARLRVVEGERDAYKKEARTQTERAEKFLKQRNEQTDRTNNAEANLAALRAGHGRVFKNDDDGFALATVVAGAATAICGAALGPRDGSITLAMLIGLTIIGLGAWMFPRIDKVVKGVTTFLWILLLALFTYQQAVKTSEASFKTVDAGSVGSYATASDAGDIVWAVSTSVNLKLGETRRWIGGDSAECAAKGIAPMTGVVDSDGRSTRVRMGPGSYYTFSDGTSVECEAEPKFSHEKFLLPPDEPAQKKK